MPSAIVRKLILTQELQSVENTLYMHETRVGCGKLTKDERMVAQNQEAMVKLIMQKDFLQKKLAEVNTELDKEKHENADAASDTDGATLGS